MLIETELKIKVTNDGKSNNVELSFNPKDKLQDVLTVLKLAEKSIHKGIEEHLLRNEKLTESELPEMLREITLEELYAGK